MGRIKRGILGGFSGKVANVVGGSWKGIAYMRSQPLSVANPKTAAQTTQRTGFSFTSKIASELLSSIVKPLWDRFAQQMSGYNHFVSVNESNLQDWATSSWADLIISQGKMAATPIAVAGGAGGNEEAVITWSPALTDNYQQATDLAYVVVKPDLADYLLVADANTARSTGTITVSMSQDSETGDDIHAYLAFKRVDGSIVSNTAYKFGTFT